MSHIVIDARELRTSTGRYVERLLHYLQQLHADHTYTVLLKPKDMDGWEPSDSRFSKVACPYKEFTFSEQLGYAKQLYGLKADLVHFGKTEQPILYFKRSITTVHDLTAARFHNPNKSTLVSWVKRQVYKVVILWVAWKSKRILTPSQFVAHDLKHFTHSTRPMTVTYEAADKIVTSPVALPRLQNIEYIMYIGRPTPHKNLDRLVEAFQLLQADRPSLHLVLAGKIDANYQRLRDRLEAAGQKNVIFTDFISDEQLRWLYEHTAVYCFPSLSEGFGLPGLEAMQYGAPVASSNATCLPEIYGDGAVYFDPTDVKDMTAKIEQLLTDKNLRKKVVAAASKQVNTYSWQRMAEQTLAEYDKALTS
ncbi:MAG: glycosyl transferase family 1 [Candidatus Saccharibacteria bacterium]|nr:glycosyl transferase family 1 [Candidatus Saccharibacteria bacterium]